MGRKRGAANQPDARPRLTMSRSQAEQRLNGRIVIGRELDTVRIVSPEQYEEADAQRSRWEKYNADMLTSMFTDSTISEEYSRWYIASLSERSFTGKVKEYHESIRDKIVRLESIKDRLELYEEPTDPGQPRHLTVPNQSASRKIFVVHGRDEEAKLSVARMLERLALEAIILHEQAARGRTLVEKFEAHSDVAFAVVLLTPDDIGYPADEPDAKQPRARQNVILELGYFVGRLGRDRVCALKRGVMEVPSDYLGVEYVSMDPSGAWRLLLAGEIQAAGIDVDLNRLTRT